MVRSLSFEDTSISFTLLLLRLAGLDAGMTKKLTDLLKQQLAGLLSKIEEDEEDEG